MLGQSFFRDRQRLREGEQCQRFNPTKWLSVGGLFNEVIKARNYLQLEHNSSI